MLDGLTEAQRRAVITPASPLCIQAAAGSGKTRVLTRRIAYRVATGAASPEHILALTFTRKAAGELTSRLGSLGVRVEVTAGTFHALAFAQLRQHWRDGGQPAPTLLDRKVRLLGQLVAGRPQVADAPLSELATEIEWAKARLIGPDRYEDAVAATGRTPPVPAGAVASLYARYETEKQRRRLADFDDLLSRCAEAMERDAGFAAAQRWRWRHLFVDEFQDVNPLQFRLVLAWLGQGSDLCVVGDVNQAIYGWNGADPALFQTLPERWPTTEVIRLDANHRCTPQVVATAAAVLGSGGTDLRSSRPDGPLPAIRSYADDRAEAHGVAGELRRAHAAGMAWSQMAVLMRTNAQAPVFEEALRAAQVPYRVASGDGVLDHKAVRAVLGRLAKRPAGPFAMVAADLEAIAAAEIDEGAPAQSGSVSGTDPGADERRAALVGLAALARTYERADQQPTTEGFLDWLRAGSGESSGNPRGAAGAVTLSSFHRAKGLEWLAVWVTGLERGLVPNGHAVTPAAQAEERRLLYVALTRAEQELHCSWSQHRDFGGRAVPREPSPWLDLIAQAGINAAGDPGCDATELSRQRLRLERDRLERSRPRRGARCPDADPAIVEALRAWRSRAARAAAVPPYVLLHDVTLAALAAARPSTIEELTAVPGMGQVKATRYGSTLLAVMADQRASA